MALLVNADEMRVYGGDGDYIVRVSRWDREARSEFNALIKQYNSDHAPELFPEDVYGDAEREAAYVESNDLYDELRQFQIDRLDYLDDQLDWISYEFIPLEE
jgi:hypothetical protein